MGLDQNLYLCKGKAKNGVLNDNEVLDHYFRKNHALHQTIEEICLNGNSTNVEYIWIEKEQWELIKKAMESTESNIFKFMESTGHDRDWTIEDLKEFEKAAKEIEENKFFKTGIVCYYSWW